MSAGKNLWFILVTVLGLVFVFGGAALVGASGSQSGALSTQSPALTPADGGGWRSGGPYGGDVQALALSPAFATDGLALAGGYQIGPSTPGGYGIARTTDGGATWKLLQDEQHGWPVFDLAISPAFTTDHTAFAGTDVGLLRSTDRGDTWMRLYGGLPDSTAHDPRGTDDISRVRLSPDFGSDGVALALQREGALYRSTNRGAGWTNVLAGTVSAVAFARDFATNHTAYAALPDAGGGSTQLKRSIDGGLTWSNLLTLPVGQVNDILETVEGGLLLATGDGVRRLMPDGAGYSETPSDPSVPGPVSRLATAGDNIYAAGFNGLYISLSFGRGWNRVSETPITPFQAVAPCPLWGSCHAVLAGTRQGLLGTPDDNWQPWAWLPGPSPIPAKSVSASPAYEADSTLFAGTNFGVFRSTDRGLSWQRMTGADAPGYPYAYPTVRVSPAYATDGTVFATVADLARPRATLYKSTDRGATWTMLPDVTESGALALSPTYGVDRTLFMANDATLRKSTDGGQTWRSFAMVTPAAGFYASDLKVSSAYATDHTLFATGFDGTLRSTDGGETWVSVGTHSPAYGLAISPNYAADGTAWHTFRSIESAGDGSPESAVVRTTDRGASWSFATSGLPGVYEPFPIPLAASPRYATDKTLFTMFSGQFVAGSSHSLYRALDGGNWWNDLGPAPGNPDGRDLAVTAFTAGGLTAHAATTDGVWHYEAPCEERLAAGGFEGTTAELDNFWQLPATEFTAAYSTQYAHAGAQSLRTGIDGDKDKFSYSSGSQYVTIPAGAASATLDFWWYPVSAEEPLAAPAARSAELALVTQALAGNTPDEVMAGDRQYVLILNSDGKVPKILLWTRSNARTWQQATFDLSAYRGLTIRLLFGTYNDGNGSSTALYSDDAALTVCWPTPPTPTATSTTRPLKRTYLPLILRNIAPPPPSPTPTATATPTNASDLLQGRWLRSLVAAPGETGRLWGITNEGYLMRSGNRGATWETVVLPAELTGTLDEGYIGMDYVNPNMLYLGAREQGLWRSTDGGVTWIKRHPLDTGPITVSLDDPATLWAGNWDAAYRPLARSTDSGLIWGTTSQGIAAQSSPISPILVDPQAHNVLYSLFMGSRGLAELYRSSAGNWWETLPAPINNLPLGWTSPGLMMDSSTRGLYVGSPDGTLSVSYNAFTPVRGEVAWQTVQTFGYQPVPLAVGAGPAGSALYITLRDQAWDPSTRGRVMRSDDGGVTWIALTIPAPAGVPPTLTATRTATPTPTVTPTVTPDCALNPPPTPEPLWVDPVTSPTSLLSQTLKVYLGRGREITVSSEAGVTTVTGAFSSTTPALVSIPLLPNTTHNLAVQGRVEYSSGCFYTLNTRLDRNGAPLVVVQQGPTATSTPTATPTATPSLTPTATPTIDAIPTAAPDVWPTPRVLATLKLPPGSRPNGIALDAAGNTAYVTFHGVDHSGRTLGVMATDPFALTSTIEISAAPVGPNQVAVVPREGMDPLVAVTARQTDELVLVAPPGVHRRFGVGDMPDGVIAAGDYLYTANFGADNVSIFDRNTLAWAGTLAVGHEPSLFAADPEMGDVYLSLHGANKIARLHDISVASEYSDIPAPYGLALDPASRRLYVANRGPNQKVTVIDLTTGSVIGALSIGAEPFVLAVNPDTGHLFVACGDHVNVYRTADWSLITMIPVPPGAEEGITVDTMRDRVYVTSRDSDALTVIQDAAPPRVLFTSDRDGNTELYSMLPDGREQKRLTTSVGSGEGDATGSPDGRWIAYSRVEADGKSYLWLMSRDGHNPRPIALSAGQDSHPTWSADSSRLAFARYDGANADIYTLRLADGIITRLTSGPSAELGPDWSWANGRIAFESNQGGANSEIFSMASDGSDVHQASINPNGDAQPSWSPEGDRIAFWGSRAEQTIYRMNANGSGLVPLVSRTLRPGAPHWGPTSASGWIVFTGYQPGSGYSEVLRMTSSGAGLALLTLNEVNFDAATGWLPGTP